MKQKLFLPFVKKNTCWFLGLSLVLLGVACEGNISKEQHTKRDRIPVEISKKCNVKASCNLQLADVKGVDFIIFAKEVTIDWGDDSVSFYRPQKWDGVEYYAFGEIEETHFIYCSHTYEDSIAKDIRISSTDLLYLDCSLNHIVSMDIRDLASLVYLDCSWNRLTNVDICGNPYLQTMDCSSNSLRDLNVAQNLRLGKLDCSSNQFSFTALNMIHQTLPRANIKMFDNPGNDLFRRFMDKVRTKE